MNNVRNPNPYLSIRVELKGHEQGVSDMAWRPDGRVLASASKDGTIRLWDLSERRELMILRGHEQEITSLSFSPDGSRLASCSQDATIRCWHVADGKEYHRFNGPTGFKSVAWSLDAMHLCAIQTKVIHIFSLKTGVIEDVLFLHERWAHRALWLQDGTIVSGGDDDNLIMWNVVTGRPFAKYQIGHGGIKEIAYSIKARRLATGSADRCIQLWNLEPWQEIGKVENAPGRIHRMSFSYNGEALAVATETDCLSFYSCEPMSYERSVKYEASPVKMAIFHPKRSILAIAVEDTIQIADIDLEALRVAMTGLRQPLGDRTPLQRSGDNVRSINCPPGMRSLSSGNRPIELFYSYSHKDEKLREKLETHLALLKRQSVIAGWHDRKIGAGQEWAGQIDEHLNSAQIILLLISADFLASDYCYDVELKRAMERHEAGETRVVPIILRPCDWHSTPFGKLKALPQDGKPMTNWSNRDEAFLDVVQGVRRVAYEISKHVGQMT